MVGVSHLEPYGGARCHALKQSRQHFHAVGLFPWRDDCRLPRTAAVEFVLHTVEVDCNACGHTVDNAAHGSPVRLAERRQPENFTKCVHR